MRTLDEKIELAPCCDAHLPDWMKQGQDPRSLYWAECLFQACFPFLEVVSTSMPCKNEGPLTRAKVGA